MAGSETSSARPAKKGRRPSVEEKLRFTTGLDEIMMIEIERRPPPRTESAPLTRAAMSVAYILPWCWPRSQSRREKAAPSMAA
jgi:hypothetical protein